MKEFVDVYFMFHNIYNNNNAVVFSTSSSSSTSLHSNKQTNKTNKHIRSYISCFYLLNIVTSLFLVSCDLWLEISEQYHWEQRNFKIKTRFKFRDSHKPAQIPMVFNNTKKHYGKSKRDTKNTKRRLKLINEHYARVSIILNLLSLRCVYVSSQYQCDRDGGVISRYVLI